MLNNEECWVLKGSSGRWSWSAKYDRYTTGATASVAFDPEYIWNNRNNIIGWIHTHPHWAGYPSSTDDATMKAQCLALGRPMLCCIIGTDKLRAWWYMDDESNPIEVPTLCIGKKIYGLKPKRSLT